MKLLTLGGENHEVALLETERGQFVRVEGRANGTIHVTVFQHDTAHKGEEHVFKAETGDSVRWFITWRTESQTYYNAVPTGSPFVTDHCVCQDCVTPQDERRIELDEVSIWEEGSDGWEAPQRCDRCGRDMQVEVTEGGG